MVRFSPGCGCCNDDCGCRRGTNPDTWTVVVKGVVNGDCTSCDDYNGTYTLTRVSGQTCEWEYVFATAACGCPYTNYVDRISLVVAPVGADLTSVAVSIQIVTAYYPCVPDGCVYQWVEVMGVGSYVLVTSCASPCTCPNPPTVYEGDYAYRDCSPATECYDLNDGVNPGNTCGFGKNFDVGHNCELIDEPLTDIDNDCYGVCDFSGASCAVTANGPFA